MHGLDPEGHSVDVFGPPDGIPVLAIAGGGADRRSWRRLIPELCLTESERHLWKPVTPSLSDSYRVAAWDQAGVGESASIAPHRTVAEYAREAESVATACLTAPFIVLGQSLGGCVALQLAIDRPDLVAAVVLAATFAGVDQFIPAADAGSIGLPDTTDPVRQSLGSAAAPSFSEWFPRREPELFWAVAEQQAAQHPDAQRAQVELFLSHQLTERLRTLAVPAIVVCGTHDRTFPPPNSEFLARTLPAAELRLVRAGHGLHVEAPDELITAVDAVAVMIDWADKTAGR